MSRVLVLANETIGGAALLDAIRRRRAEDPDTTFFVVVPQTKPRYGNVIYDHAVRDGAQVRVDLSLAFMREEGIEGDGEVGDPDPFNAAMDAIAEHRLDSVIVSTLPASSSGWLRRDLPERIEQESGLPVEHVVVDLAKEGLPFDVTLVVANRTAADEALVDRLRTLGEEGPRRFIVVLPQDSGDGKATAEARERLRALLAYLEDAGLVAAGFIGDPDPFDATMNALQFFHISEVVISTMTPEHSDWLKAKLPERVRAAANVRVEHVMAREIPAAAAEA
jgi:hypothetical protein